MQIADKNLYTSLQPGTTPESSKLYINQSFAPIQPT
jgi:hypothetical protein